MKRLLLGLVMVGGLALASASMANAAAPAECGHSYAILMNGAEPSTVSATGAATLPGAVTQAVGVGSITFGTASGTSCTVTGGELIYNAGDIQTNPAGVYASPASCFAPISALGSGIPCFDGGNHITGTLSAGGPGGSAILSIVSSYTWLDASVTSGTIPFGFWVTDGLGSSTAVGTSIPGTASPTDSGPPVLTLTLSKQDASGNGSTFGTTPYIGTQAVSCSGYGANATDFVASSQDSTPPAGPSGGFGSTLGEYAIFGASWPGGGQLSFNTNDYYTLSATSVPPNNEDCAFTLSPANSVGNTDYDNSPSATSAALFADGSANFIASVGSSGTACTDANTAGSGYADSSVLWGATDGSSYVLVTGLVSTATGFVPPGDIATCVGSEISPAVPSVLQLVSSTIVAVGTTVSKPVEFYNFAPADCDLELSMATASSGSCTVKLTPTAGSDATDSLGPNTGFVNSPVAISCTCGTVGSGAASVTSSLSISSVACKLTDQSSSPYTITCKN